MFFHYCELQKTPITVHSFIRGFHHFISNWLFPCMEYLSDLYIFNLLQYLECKDCASLHQFNYKPFTLPSYWRLNLTFVHCTTYLQTEILANEVVVSQLMLIYLSLLIVSNLWQITIGILEPLRRKVPLMYHCLRDPRALSLSLGPFLWSQDPYIEHHKLISCSHINPQLSNSLS